MKHLQAAAPSRSSDIDGCRYLMGILLPWRNLFTLSNICHSSKLNAIGPAEQALREGLPVSHRPEPAEFTTAD
jgi:hypothetical protein